VSRALAALLAGLLAGGTLTPRIESLPLSAVDGTNGATISGAGYGGQLGWAVAGAGDVNGDGRGDIVIGAYQSGVTGAAYVVFNGADWAAHPVLEDQDLDGTNGFRLTGEGDYAWTGVAVAGAGDVNGDGYDDVIVGAGRADVGAKTDAGSAYVVFGRADWSGTPVLALGSLAAGAGFRVDGGRGGDYAGEAVAGAGDVNGDGFDDVIVGAPGANPGSRNDAGAACVVFGRADWADTTRVALAALDGTDGFCLEGIDAGDRAGTGVAGPGDLNGDGRDDVAIGAPGATVGSAHQAGEAYVVLGAAQFPAVAGLGSLDGTNGSVLYGREAGDGGTGSALAGAGDLNGDGRGDLAVGAAGANPFSRFDAGLVFVLFGAADFPAAVDLTGLDGTDGVAFAGAASQDFVGRSLAAAGDTNGDGIGDLVIGGSGVYMGWEPPGAAYLMYGRLDWTASPLFDLAEMTGSDGRHFDRGAANDAAGTSVGGAFDLNGDGLSDVVVGAPRAASHKGAAYVVFGAAPPRCRGRVATVFGGNGADTLTGTPGNDVITGLAGNDIIDGGGGNDIICGDTGDDQITGGPGNDMIDGGTGTDWASFGTATAGVTASLSTRKATGQGTDTLAGIENLRGSPYGDTLIGNGRVNNLQGSGGDDVVRGLGGNDVLGGGLGADTVDYTGSPGRVTVDLALGVAGGGAGIDFISDFERVTGSAYGDALYGDGVANVLNGVGGDDVLRGREGNDSLDGGAGVDTGDGGGGSDTCLVETKTACELSRPAGREEP
jgi:Ca2+-binding RTX toxin-like protein